MGLEYDYETLRLPYTIQRRDAGSTKHVCLDCGSGKVGYLGIYMPDFLIKGTNIIIETKGLFSAKDMKKMEDVIRRHPQYKFYMQLMYDNWWGTTKTKKYSDWCKKVGVEYGIGVDLWYLKSFV